MRLSSSAVVLTLFGASFAAFSSCSDDETNPTPSGDPTCETDVATFEPGDPNGHADPLGAPQAGQARAGHINASDVPQPAHGRQRIEDGDFVLINDKIAVVIEDVGLSDGYGRFGGEVLAIDQVGAEGQMRGVSRFVETLVGVGIKSINAESVTVVNDGSDGGTAIVRVIGRLDWIPFMQTAFSALIPADHDVEAAIDYVLEPGSEKLLMRFGVVNDTTVEIDTGPNHPGSDELYGFFQLNHNQVVTAEDGYDKPGGKVGFVGFDGGEWGFAYRGGSADEQLEFGFTQSGFFLFWGDGFVADACAQTTVDQVEIVAGGPHYDGLREAIRRVDGAPAWREIHGQVIDYQGTPLGGAWVHETDEAGNYLSRTQADPDGRFSIHAPDSAIRLIPHVRGYPKHDGAVVETGTDEVDLAFTPHGYVHVTATDLAMGNIPVRVQIIPTESSSSTPDSFGTPDWRDGRLHQDFAMTGDTTLVVPQGEHQVLVTRGYEWEMLDTTVTVAAGDTVDVAATLEHSVDSAGWMCADFHIHSFMSADSSDSFVDKVTSAVADGLDIPVSSEHEWVVDFQPVVEELGLADWAFGGSSLELTTFAWGHFGVVPMAPRPDLSNLGAIEWAGRAPAEVFADVHALDGNPALIVNHPNGTGFGGYFGSARFDEETGTSLSDLWSEDFDAVEVFNSDSFDENRDKTIRSYSALLNTGKKVWAVGSSDSHSILTDPVGYPRTCLWFGHDDPRKLSGGALRDAILSGHITISGGPLLTVVSESGAGPGDTISGAGDHSFTVTVQSPSWLDVDTLEVFVNGETVGEQALTPAASGTAQRFVDEVTVTFDGSVAQSWVMFHAKGGDLSPLHPGRQAFAVSNPIFVTP